MNFGEALALLKAGFKVSRKGWNGKGMWIQLCVPCQEETSTLCYITMKTAGNQHVPWLASQTDILSEDWSGIQP